MLDYTNFEKLKEQAGQDPDLRKKLLNTRNESNSLSSFCRIARQHGCELSPMDIIEAGEDSYAAMRRSTNGGGENSPMLGSWNNFFEMFLAELELM